MIHSHIVHQQKHTQVQFWFAEESILLSNGKFYIYPEAGLSPSPSNVHNSP